MKQDFGMGAIPNVYDERDIPASAVMAPVETPSSFFTNIDHLSVENQMIENSCVGQAIGKRIDDFEHKEKGSDVSKRFIYSRAKTIDGIPASVGTYPRIGAKIVFDEGAPKRELVPDINTLPEDEYRKFELTDEIKKDAQLKRVKGYAFVNPNIAEMKQAIVANGLITATLQCGDWSVLPVKPTPSRGYHYVIIYGYEDVSRETGMTTRFHFLNSWGKEWGQNGRGYFDFADYEGKFFDVIAFVDMPNSYIEEAKKKPYQFIRTLKRGMSGNDVMELQKRLKTEVAVDGLPCFRWNGPYTSYFGPETQKAVQRYQIVKKIVSSGTEATTGFGQLGPKTRASLNQGVSSMLDPWALAIQEFEGWFSGSRSQRNNNPGNIKHGSFAVSKGATGKDSGGFAVFPNYTIGFTALKALLELAAKGKSKLYNPEYGLYEESVTRKGFCEVYAPSEDNNNPRVYAQFIAGRLGVAVDTPIKNLV